MENQPILNTDTSQLIFEDWGLIDYEISVEKQLQYVEEVATHNSRGYLIFCTHPPIVTKGRSTQEGDIFSWQGPVYESARGGRATYHGPSQIVVYPIINLKIETPHRKAREVVGHLRLLEKGIINTLKHFGIEAVGKSTQDDTGVWVGEKKIASLGIAARKWVTYHGAAINFESDPRAFEGIRPCGFQKSTMTNVQEISKSTQRAEFANVLKHELIKLI